MPLPKKLYKTTFTVWTDYPTGGVEIEALAREATNGDAFCSGTEHETVTDPEKFPKTEFFGVDDEDEAPKKKRKAKNPRRLLDRK